MFSVTNLRIVIALTYISRIASLDYPETLEVTQLCDELVQTVTSNNRGVIRYTGGDSKLPCTLNLQVMKPYSVVTFTASILECSIVTCPFSDPSLVFSIGGEDFCPEYGASTNRTINTSQVLIIQLHGDDDPPLPSFDLIYAVSKCYYYYTQLLCTI